MSKQSNKVIKRARKVAQTKRKKVAAKKTPAKKKSAK
jgi:hypothetical protein